MGTSVKVQMPDVIPPPRPPPPVLPPEDPERDDPNEPDYKPPLVPPPVLNRFWDRRALPHAAPQAPVASPRPQAWLAKPERQPKAGTRCKSAVSAWKSIRRTASDGTGELARVR